VKRSILFSWIILLMVSLCQPAYAQDDMSGTPWERFSVSLGGFSALSNSDVRLGTTALGGGVDVDIEEALNVDVQQSALRLDALYRIGEARRHRVGLSYFEFRRKGTAVVAEDIDIGDPPIPLPAGNVVNTYYNTGILKADYGYSFFMDERFNLAVSGGLFVMPIEIGIDNTTTGDSTRTAITAPLPVVGFSFDFALSPKWMLKQRMELLYLKYGNFTGAILDANFAVEWNVWEHWGFGAQIDSFRMGIEAHNDNEDVPGVDFTGSIKMNYTGLGLYTRYRF
jgi:hypothetical protein